MLIGCSTQPYDGDDDDLMIRMAGTMMTMTMNVDADSHWLIGLRWLVFRLKRNFTPFYVSSVLKEQKKKISKCVDTLH